MTDPVALAATRPPHAGARPSVIVLSLAAALLFSIGAVLQHRAATLTPREESLKPALLRRLACRPSWLLANVANLFAFALQLLAVRHGSLLVVQLILVTALLFALPMEASAARRSLNRREWTGAIAVVAGLALFLVVASPDVGNMDATAAGWALVAVAFGAPAVILVGAAHRSEGNSRAAYLGAAAGIVYGVTGALTKSSAHLLDRGMFDVVTSWQPYALVVLALAGLLLSQSAFQAGALKLSLPLFTLGEPVVAAVIAVLVFHEGVAASPAAGVVEAVAALGIAAGVVLLTRSPLVAAGV